MLNFIQRETQQSQPFIFDTIAKLRGVHRLLTLQASASKLSDRRVATIAGEMLGELSADMVVIKADAKGSTYEPTQQELELQLKTYGDLLPQGRLPIGAEPPAAELVAARKYAFGYRHPHKVKLEWMTIPMAAIRGSIDGTDAVNGVALAKYWQKNQCSFRPKRAATADSRPFAKR